MPSYDMESSSSLIVNVIRILSNSKDDEDRDAIRKKLEDCLDASDQKLTKLVSEHYKDLRSVMNTFTKIAKNLQSLSSKLEQAKQRLMESREMLTTKICEIQKVSEELQKTSEEPQMISEELQHGETVPHKTDEESTNVFNRRTETTDDSFLFKFSRSSYAMIFRLK